MDNCTVAMLIAEKNIIPPKEWEYDKFIKGRFNKISW